MDYCSNYNEFWITGNGYDNEYMERDRGETDTQSQIGRYNGKEKEREKIACIRSSRTRVCRNCVRASGATVRPVIGTPPRRRYPINLRPLLKLKAYVSYRCNRCSLKRSRATMSAIAWVSAVFLFEASCFFIQWRHKWSCFLLNY